MPKKGKRKSHDRSFSKDPPPLPSSLKVIQDGHTLPFVDYTSQFTHNFYPEITHGVVMVPPLTFHRSWLSIDSQEMKNLKDTISDGQRIYKNVTISSKNEAYMRSDEAEHRVATRFKWLAEQRQWQMTIILSHKFENYLDKIKHSPLCPARPATFGYERGEHDILLVHPDCGIIDVSVKSVGNNFRMLSQPGKDREILRKVLRDACSQLDREVKVIRKVLSDVVLDLNVIAVLALPNITRAFLTSTLQTDISLKEDLNMFFKCDSSLWCLCSEEFPPLEKSNDTEGLLRTPPLLEESLSSVSSENVADPNIRPESIQETEYCSVLPTPPTVSTAVDDSVLYHWFHQRFYGEGREVHHALSQEEYEDIVGRYCGLLSTVEIHHSKCRGRKEVRSMSEAISEVSSRFRALVLLPFQARLLNDCSLTRVYMHGVMGSGKSVMLTLKARQWLASGCDVIIINISYDVSGSPIGYAVLRDVNNEFEGDEGNTKANIVNVKLSEFSEETFIADIIQNVGEKRNKVHFCIDEVYKNYGLVTDAIIKTFPDAEIWAAGLDKENCPVGFHSLEMKKVLRCPPSVQRILQWTDYEKERIQLYETCGATQGQPAEGPDPIFIRHDRHSTSASGSCISASVTSCLSLHCEQCATETIDIFKRLMVGPEPNKGLIGSGSTKTIITRPGIDVTRQERDYVKNALVISFKDVVILCKDAEIRKMYPREGNIYRLKSEVFEEFIRSLEQSVYLRRLREAGYPVHVVNAANSERLAVPEEDAITASWVNPASGLEWTVVIYLPGDPPQGEVTLPPAHGNTEDLLRFAQKRMSEPDVRYLFWAASRCTSQLIVLIP